MSAIFWCSLDNFTFVFSRLQPPSFLLLSSRLSLFSFRSWLDRVLGLSNTFPFEQTACDFMPKLMANGLPICAIGSCTSFSTCRLTSQFLPLLDIFADRILTFSVGR